MKKTIAILMLIALAFMLTGCSNAVKETEEAIAAIATAENNYSAINDAQEKYNALDDKQKAKVSNIGILHFAQAEKAINRISYISDLSLLKPLSMQSDIHAANAAFDQLTDEQKQQLENADALTTANARLEEAIAARTAAQSLAEEIFLSNSYMFKHPETLVLKRAWYSNMLGRHNFTFEVEAKNGLGIMETSYYGNEFFSASITNTPIASTMDELDLLGNKFFEEGEIKAMDETEEGYGVLLNVDAIMTYFRRNR